MGKTSVGEVLEAIARSRADSAGAGDERRPPEQDEVFVGDALVAEGEVVEDPQASAIRLGVADLDAARLSTAALTEKGANAVNEMMTVLRASEKIVVCASMDELAAALAKDENTTEAAAKEKLVDNQARAFTAETDGVIYFLECDENPHDMVHETVHVTSAPGGTTKIKTRFGDPLNEGFTEMFTIEYCKQLGVPEAPGYPNEVRFVKQLGRAIGVPALFDAYMKDAGLDNILSLLSSRWAEKSRVFATRPHQQKFVAPDGDTERQRILVDRLADGAFLDGANKPFWNAVL